MKTIRTWQERRAEGGNLERAMLDEISELRAELAAAGAVPEGMVDDALAKVGELGTVGAMKWLATRIAAAPPAQGLPAAHDDPMDWPLPCDVTVGCGTISKGVPLRTLVLRMKNMNDMIREGWASARAPAAAPSEPVACTHGQAYGIIDPDYARYYSIIRCTAWQYGYAIGMHGSFTRDLDLIAVPWADNACAPDRLVKVICGRTDLTEHHKNPTEKPHGRLVFTLMLPGFGDPRWVDLSIVPAATPPAQDAGTGDATIVAIGYESGFMATDPDHDGATVKLHYRDEATAEAAFCAITRIIDRAIANSGRTE